MLASVIEVIEDERKRTNIENSCAIAAGSLRALNRQKMPAKVMSMAINVTSDSEPLPKRPNPVSIYWEKVLVN